MELYLGHKIASKNNRTLRYCVPPKPEPNRCIAVYESEVLWFQESYVLRRNRAGSA